VSNNRGLGCVVVADSHFRKWVVVTAMGKTGLAQGSVRRGLVLELLFSGWRGSRSPYENRESGYAHPENNNIEIDYRGNAARLRDWLQRI